MKNFAFVALACLALSSGAFAATKNYTNTSRSNSSSPIMNTDGGLANTGTSSYGSNPSPSTGTSDSTYSSPSSSTGTYSSPNTGTGSYSSPSNSTYSSPDSSYSTTSPSRSGYGNSGSPSNTRGTGTGTYVPGGS